MLCIDEPPSAACGMGLAEPFVACSMANIWSRRKLYRARMVNLKSVINVNAVASEGRLC
jgi:hypothetical protein